MMSAQKNFSRRQFIARTGQLSATIAAASALASCSRQNLRNSSNVKTIGANDRINLAFIGVRSRGNQLLNEFTQQKNVRVAALCDVDGNVLSERAAQVEKNFGYKPAVYKDMRLLLEDRNIDVVVIANPNSWHALSTIWACQAGKHVYVEKPCCHNMYEGRKMIEAASKYNRVVQTGFQNRSTKGVQEAMAFLHSGGIGEVYMARGLCFKPRGGLGMVPDGVGSGKEFEYFSGNRKGENYDQAYINKVDYNLWTGPAELKPFNYNRFHYNWHWNWAYGGGDNANQGPHQWDIARWGLNKNEHPVTISSSGDFYGKPCAQNTPNTQSSSVKYSDGKMIEFEVRGLPTNDEVGIRVGNFFYGTKGWLHLNGSNWQSYMGTKNELGPGSKSKEQKGFDLTNLAGVGGGGHIGNFIHAIRTNNADALNCGITEGYMSSALSLLTNISYRTGRTLAFDGQKEKFIGDNAANKMLTRKYRKPFIVPAKV